MRFFRLLLLALASVTAGCGSHTWTKTDTALQVAVTASLVADYSQTRAALDSDGVEENPIMGRSGDRMAPEVYFPVAGVALAGAAVALPRPWRNLLQGTTLMVQAHTIAGNWRAGYTIQF